MAKITNRLSPCRCGCQGGDPWHAKAFKRVVKSVRDVEGERREAPKATTVRYRIMREGEARFPWGWERVVEIQNGWSKWDGEELLWTDATREDGTPVSGGWWIAREQEA